MNKLSLAAASVALALGLAGCGDKNTTTETKTVAAAPVAALSSGIETANFDTAVRPQDDFYNYVNGTWMAKTEIPADKSNYGSFTALYEESQAAMKTIIEQAAAKQFLVAGSDEQKLGDFYKSYMNEALVEELGLKPLTADLDKIAALKDKSELAGMMAYLERRGGTIPLGWYVNNDAKNSSSYAVYVDQAGLGLPDRDYYLKADEKFAAIRADYQTYISEVFAKMGVADGEAKAKAILALETRIAEAMWDRVASRDATKTYNKMSMDELAAKFTGFDFAAYRAGAGFNAANEVIIGQPSYFEALAKMVNDVDVATWQAYFSFHLVSNYSSLLNKDFADHKFAFYSTRLRGVKEQQPRWKKAVDAANDVLGEVLGKIYVEQNFTAEAKARMGVMVQNVIKAYSVAINELTWMSPETKKAAQEKLSKFTPKIGYPDKWKDYNALTINPTDLVGNFIRNAEWSHDDMAAKLGKPVDRSEWHMTPQTVNAYYNPVMNEIVFPAAILQPPFFNMAADDAANYGGIGAVIGHELGHGFDDQGAKYDGDGNLRDWWSEQDLAEFEKRGAQLAAQYDQYQPFPDANVNGKFTLGENIGDLGGLAVAYRAYQFSLNNQPAPVIEGFTGDQRFFMGWAQVWRRKYRDEELRTRLMTDPHSPSQYRVQGIVSNMPAFYKAFDVKEGDKMYIAPEQRVQIW